MAHLAKQLIKRVIEGSDFDYLSKRLAIARTPWKPGDKIRSFHQGGDPTTIKSIKGDIVKCADGSQGHISRVLPAGYSSLGR